MRVREFVMLTTLGGMLATAVGVSWGQGLPPTNYHEEHRAGYPQQLSRFARPSKNHAMFGYWVGGGAVSRHRGEAPYANEGTWGWDYRGWIIPRRVDLLWWHGRRAQGGPGAYKTDGPHLPHLHHEGGNGHGVPEAHGGESHGTNGHGTSGGGGHE